MQWDHLAVYVVAGLVVVLTLATGPYLHMLPIPEGGLGGGTAIGEGSANVEIHNAPDHATLEPANYADIHYLRVPETMATVSNVQGAPLLTVSIDIRGLGYRRSSVFSLRDQSGETRSYGIEGGSIESDRIESDTYSGTLRFVLRDDRDRTVLYEDRIVIEVAE